MSKTTKEFYGVPVTIAYINEPNFFGTSWEVAGRLFMEYTEEEPTDEMIAEWIRQTI